MAKVGCPYRVTVRQSGDRIFYTDSVNMHNHSHEAEADHSIVVRPSMLSAPVRKELEALHAKNLDNEALQLATKAFKVKLGHDNFAVCMPLIDLSWSRAPALPDVPAAVDSAVNEAQAHGSEPREY